MSYYYYNTETRSFTDSSVRLQGPQLIELNDLEYLVSRALVKGYTLYEVKEAVETLRDKMEVS